LGPPAGDVPYGLTGLSPKTVYHFQVVASTSGGTSYGGDLTFKTTTAAPSLPSVQTLTATGITTTAATANGSVNPNGASSTFYFEYGTTTSYGATTPSGNTAVAISVSGPITGLTPNTPYHYRFVAFNSVGITYGSDIPFTTSGAGTVAPIFSSSPQSQTVQAGANVSFAATATGLPTPNYHWSKNGSPIGGATDPTLNLT